MALSDKPRLRVLSDGRRRHINVPSGFALPLLILLRKHGVRCDPPSPYLVGVDNIELYRDTDADRVQAILDGWE